MLIIFAVLPCYLAEERPQWDLNPDLCDAGAAPSLPDSSTGRALTAITEVRV